MFHTFNRWRENSQLEKKKKAMKKTAEEFRKNRLLRVFLQIWNRKTFQVRKINIDAAWHQKIEQVSNSIIAQYEQELAKLRSQLEMAHQQIEVFNTEKQKMHSEMKKAFMRGVTALNLEAMTMFSSTTKGAPEPVPSLQEDRTEEVQMYADL